MTSLNGTPAEAGVRAEIGRQGRRDCRVSVEPPPMQGCEACETQLEAEMLKVSVEPPPKQGCEKLERALQRAQEKSQWNPRRSRGARRRQGNFFGHVSSLSGTPAEAGVRAVVPQTLLGSLASLSGTPAEAGVREAVGWLEDAADRSQWNPRRSRGARRHALNLPMAHGVVSVEPPPKQGCEARSD